MADLLSTTPLTLPPLPRACANLATAWPAVPHDPNMRSQQDGRVPSQLTRPFMNAYPVPTRIIRLQSARYAWRGGGGGGGDRGGGARQQRADDSCDVMQQRARRAPPPPVPRAYRPRVRPFRRSPTAWTSCASCLSSIPPTCSTTRPPSRGPARCRGSHRT